MQAVVAPSGQPAAAIEFEMVTAIRARFPVFLQDSSVTFVARPIRVRTRKGKDYHVLRVTIPKEAAQKLQLGADDYLLLKARVAEWFHLMDWSAAPEIWQRLPAELRSEVVRSGLPCPSEVPGLPAPTSPAGLAAAAGSTGTGSALTGP